MRMPTSLTLPPSRFLLRLVSIDLLALTLALGMGFVLHGDPSAYTGEGEPVTWLSFAHLLTSGGLAGVVFRAIGVPDEGVGILLSWLDGIEETLKLCAEAALLGSVYTCAYVTAAHRNQAACLY